MHGSFGANAQAGGYKPGGYARRDRSGGHRYGSVLATYFPSEGVCVDLLDTVYTVQLLAWMIIRTFLN